MQPCQDEQEQRCELAMDRLTILQAKLAFVTG